MKSPRRAVQIYTLLTLGALALAITSVMMGSPQKGDAVQRILYIHLPAAAATFLACAVVFVASIRHLLRHRRRWDDVAEAAGLVALGACTVLLLTGMVWGKEAWGEWWTWSPRLTFSLILWILYAGFLILRALVPADRRAHISSVYGIIAFLDVPLVYLSARLLPDVHPASIPLDPSMKRTLLLCTVAALMLAAGLIAARMHSRRSSPTRQAPGPAITTRRLHAPPPAVPPAVHH
jgi:heme exporter protein C